jgi:acetolactate synthase I/II/III large subunit
MAQARTGGEILADALIAQGADLVFGVPGESFLAVLDAISARNNSLRFVTCRQEGGAAFMADAHAKLTGRPGIVLVTRGPGACNASIGVHTAWQDSTPMIVLIGQVARHHRDREAFQEMEYKHMFAPMAKWVCEVDSAARLPEHLSHAFHLACSGRPGPVVLALPEDVLSDLAVAADLPAARIARPAPDPAAMSTLRDRLAKAERPLAILGGPGWSAQAAGDFAAFAERQAVPIVTSLRCQDYLDNAHPNYVGDLGIAANPNVAQRVSEADLLLVVGARLGDMTTQGYTLLEPPRSAAYLAHVYPDGTEPGRVYFADLPIVADSGLVARALSEWPSVSISPERAAWIAAARADYERMLMPPPQPGALDMGIFMAALAERVPRDAILTNGAGNYSSWVHKFWQFRDYRSQLAPTSGAMGYGLPAAVAAKLTNPDRRVVAFAGDGCFLMNGQEMATVRHYGLDPLVIVVNNGILGTIQMHQAREYPDRYYGTDLTNPDFADMARSFGFHAMVLDRTEDIVGALDQALATEGPVLIECRVDPEGITPRTTRAALAAKALSMKST